MKIVIMTHALTGGGAERVAVSWANGLRRRGHDITIVTDSVSDRDYPLDEGINVVEWRPRRLMKGKAGTALAMLTGSIGLHKLLKREKPDAIIGVLFHRVLEILLARGHGRRRIPFILTDHNSFEWPEGVTIPRKRMFQKFTLSRLFDRYTVLTEADRRVLEAKGRTDNVEVLYNPLFLKPLSTVPHKENVVLAVGRLYDWHYKGFDNLIRAWNDVAPRHPDWKLRIIGSGREKDLEYLKSLSTTPGQFEILPYTTDIVSEYRKAAIYALSSRYEGWGLVMVEAMSQCCATVACDFRGRQAEAVTDGIDGLICSSEGHHDLAGSLERLISDEALRTRLQHAAPSNLTRFSEDNVARHLEAIISKAIAKINRR